MERDIRNERLVNIPSGDDEERLVFVGKELDGFGLRFYPESSTAILIGVNESEKKLYILFANGVAYLYQDVSLEVLRKAAYVDSPGKFVAMELRAKMEGVLVEWNVRTVSNEEIVTRYEGMRNIIKHM